MPSHYLVDLSKIPTQFQGSGIPCVKRRMGKSDGIMFPAGSLNAALGILGWDKKAVRFLPTCEWGIMRMVKVDGGSVGEAVGRTTDVQIVNSKYVSDDWKGYLNTVRDWLIAQSLPIDVHLHCSSAAYFQHHPQSDGRLHIFFGGQASFQEQELVIDRDVRYQCCNIWVGELYPHEESRNVIREILYCMLPRVVHRVYRSPHIDFQGCPEPTTMVRSLLRAFAEKFRRDVIYRRYHEPYEAPPVYDGRMYLHEFCRPSSTKGVVPARYVESVFGIRLPPSSRLLISSSGGFPIIMDVSNAVLQLDIKHHTNLYVLVPFAHSWETDQRTILERILQEWERTIPSQCHERQRRCAHQEEAQVIRQDQFVTDETSHIATEQGRLQHELATAQSSIRRCSEQIIGLTRQASKLQNDMDALVQLGKGTHSYLTSMLPHIAQIPGVRLVEYENRTIRMYTHNVYIPIHEFERPRDYYNGLYDIGEFCVEIFTDGRGHGVRVVNLTRTVQCRSREWYHPHIPKEEAYPCFGTMAETVPKMIGRRDYANLAGMLVKGLHQVNINDTWGGNIIYWPKASEKP